jgi:hypothetical protein
MIGMSDEENIFTRGIQLFPPGEEEAYGEGLEDGRKEGYDEGYKAGLEEGRKLISIPTEEDDEDLKLNY